MDLLIRIDCSDDQVSSLISILDDVPATVLKREDGLYLRSSEVIEEKFERNNHDRISKTWSRARDFIRITNNVAENKNKEWSPISVNNMKVIKVNGEECWYPITGRFNILSGGSPSNERRPEVEELLFLEATGGGDSKYVIKAWRLWKRERSWVNFFRIYEIIREDIGGESEIESKKWATGDKLEAFRASANNPKVTGDNARHGWVDKWDMPSNSMTLKEGRTLICRILRKWLQSKALDT